MTFLEVTLLIHEERERQIARWGDTPHSHLDWLAILVKQVGQAAEAIVKGWDECVDDKLILKQVIQLTAVGFAWLEDKLPNG